MLYGYCCLLKTLLQRETAHHTSIDHQCLEDTWKVYIDTQWTWQCGGLREASQTNTESRYTRPMIPHSITGRTPEATPACSVRSWLTDSDNHDHHHSTSKTHKQTTSRDIFKVCPCKMYHDWGQQASSGCMSDSHS